MSKTPEKCPRHTLHINFVIFCVLIILFLQTAEDICRYTTDHGFLNVRQNMQNFSQLGNQLAKDVDFPIHRIYLIYVHSRRLSGNSIFADSGPINAKFCVFSSIPNEIYHIVESYDTYYINGTLVFELLIMIM